MRYIVQTEKGLLTVRDELLKAKRFAFDTETDSLGYYRQVVGASMAIPNGPAWYVPLGHRVGLNASLELFNSVMQEVVADPDKDIWAHNWKFDLGTLRRMGLDLDAFRARPRDSMVLAHLVKPGYGLGLKQLVLEKLGYQMSTFEATTKGVSADLLTPGALATYAIEDVVYLNPLVDKLWSELLATGPNMSKVFLELETEITEMLEEMEEEGMPLDVPYLRGLEKEFVDQVFQLEMEVSQLLGGGVVKLTSPKWLSDEFIDRRKIWGVRAGAVRNKNNVYSTDATAIEDWASGLVPGTTKVGIEVAKRILRHRELKKLLSTYVQKLPRMLDHEGRLHTSINQVGTITGRFSSSDPNLQNIPVRTEQGARIRQAFIAPRPSPVIIAPRASFLSAFSEKFFGLEIPVGWTLMDVDYSQIELRMMAHFSQDPTMLRIYQEEGDIHQMTADQCGCTRGHAKGINFGLIYGMGPKKLAKTIGVDLADAEIYHRKYFQTYSGVKDYQGLTIARARRDGYVQTLIGRRRYLPDLHSQDWKVRGPAERQAVNTKIQGSAADLIKISMRNIRRRVREENLRDVLRPVLQVHDELLFYVRQDEDCRRYASSLVKGEMESAASLRVPLIAEPKFADNWREAH